MILVIDIVPDRNKKKKSRTSQGRSMNLTVCQLLTACKSVPRGKSRTALSNNGHIVELYFTRSMFIEVIREVINRGFLSFSDEWESLETGNDNLLRKAENQSPNDEVICSRCLYIVEKKVT